jgi:hypothetical protein
MNEIAMSAVDLDGVESEPVEKKTLQPLDNPIGTRLSPMSPVRSVTHVSGPGTHR